MSVMLSTIVCSYGRPDQLRQALGALDWAGLAKNQGEVLLVHVAGDDATASVMRECALLAPVATTVLPAGRGLSVARNVGVRAAAGSWLTFTDDDCLMRAGYFDNLAAALNSAAETPDYGGGGIHDPAYHQPQQTHLSGTKILGRNSLYQAGLIPGCNMFFHRRVFEKVGLFREDMGAGAGQAFVGAEDWEMGTRASLAGFLGVCLPDVVVVHDHGRAPGSAESDDVLRGYRLGAGAHYAHLLALGIAPAWQLWASGYDVSQPPSPAVMLRLQQEFEGAAHYLQHCLNKQVR